MKQITPFNTLTVPSVVRKDATAPLARLLRLLIAFVLLILSGATTVQAAIPTIASQPVDTAVTEGESATFAVTASGSSLFRYQWQKNGAAISGATTASYTTAATTLADNGAVFTVVVSNRSGSVTSSPATLTVDPPAAPPAITKQPVNKTVTEGNTAKFSVTATGAAPLRYQWRKNGANITSATASSYTTPATTPADNGSLYDVTVSNSAGSVTSKSRTLTVTAAPTPTPTATPALIAPTITTQPASKTVTAGATAKFSVTASGSAPLTFQWRKNGGDIAGATASSYTTPATTLADNGSLYDVTVSNGAGSATSKSKTLTVSSTPTPTPTPTATPAPTPPAGPVTETYMTNPDGSQAQWDIYFPGGAVPAGGWPAVLVIHAGGFHGGSPGSCVKTATDLAASGYVALAVTYRLAPNGAKHQLITGQPDTFLGRPTGTFPDQTDDIANAVRQARNPTSSSLIYGFVNGQVGAVGASAGGSHASWVATHGTAGDDRVDVAVSFSGTYDGSDFDDAWNPNLRSNWANYVNVPDTDIAAIRAASPAWADLTGITPLFMIASEADPMPPRQMPDMVASLQAAGVTNYQQLTITGALHGFAYWDQIDTDGVAVKTKAISFLAAGFAAAPPPAP